MSRIVRKLQKIFGSGAGPTEIAQYGSLAAGTPAYSTDPEVIQSLSNYLDGWFGAVIGGNSPAIEDVNALDYLFAYQLSYLLQAGVPEWNTLTEYFIGQTAADGSGNLYFSLTDNNLGNALTNTTKWALVGSRVRTITAAETLLSNDGTVRMSGAVGYNAILPPGASVPVGKKLTVKNVSASGVDMTVSSTDLIDGAASLTIGSSPTLESATMQWNGTSWDII